MNKDSYDHVVYIHKKDDVIFYVGSGSLTTKRPWGRNSRSQEWHDFCNDIFDVEIIEKFETRKEALEFEALYTQKLKDEGKPLVNKHNGAYMFGKYNGMYGKGYILKGRKQTLEHINNRRKVVIENGSFKGERNSMYGVSMKDRTTPEKYEHWKNALRGKKDCVRSGCDKVSVFNKDTGEELILNSFSKAQDIVNGKYSSMVSKTRTKGFYEFENYIVKRVKNEQ